MRSAKYEHGHRYGFDVGGRDVFIANPNRAQRRLNAKQAGKEKGRPAAPQMNTQPNKSTIQKGF